MERRDFIKNSICLSCAGLFASGCKNILINYNDIKNDKFYYKSKAGLPKKVRLEACSLCQLDCPVCTVRLLEKKAPKDWLGYLKFDDFKKFVDDNDFIEEMELSNNGEIFLNPELDEIIKYAHKKGIKLCANNGVNLNTVSEKTLENLVKYKFRSLVVALDGATPETYKIYRRGGDFNKVIDNIKKINYYKEKYNSELPKLTWQFIVFGHNEHEIELAWKKAYELNMKIVYRKNSYDPSYSPVKNEKLIEQKTGLDFSNADKIYLACKRMFDAPQIDYDGKLLGCCFIQLTSFKADVFKKGLLGALNSPDFIYAKHMLSDFSIPAKKGIPCSNCTDYEYIKEINYPLNFLDS